MSSKKFKLKTPLSEVLDKAIRQAAQDVLACNRSKQYRINMQTWHAPDSDGVCLVCMAGSAIARRTDADPDEDWAPYDDSFTDAESSMLDALDSIRTGDVLDALHLLGHWDVEAHQVKFFKEVKFDRENPECWYKHMMKIADYVERRFPNTRYIPYEKREG